MVHVLGVVGDDAESVAEKVRAADVPVRRDDAAALADVDAVVAAGESGVLEAVRAALDLPVLAVDAGEGLPSVPRDGVGDAAAAVSEGRWTPVERPVFGVTVDGEAHRALLDALLVTTTPARISEYSVTTCTERDESVEVACFRADGVVVATPAGSHGYARDAGGPRVAPGVGGAVVAPVAPFAVRCPDWLLVPPLTLRVERDESDVSLVVDGVDHGRVAPGTPVRVDVTDSARFAVVDGHSSPFPGVGPLEKT